MNAVELTEQLNRSLADGSAVKRRRARGNVLIGTLNAAVRNSGPPDGGSALLRVTFSASGELDGVELLRGAANDWAPAIQAFRARAKGKRLELPAGARGMRVTYDLSSKLQLPSGNAVGSGPIGVRPPSFAPNGFMLRGAFDPADLSGKVSRIASARVVAEEVL